MRTPTLKIDGSAGEGGGQVLRSSLALSLVTGKPFQISRIRARRKNPGLMRQHLTAVRAAATIGQAEVGGAELRSKQLSFTPGPVQPGDYHFAVGTAGSTTLVLQTVLPALLMAEAPSTVTVEGGTHNPMAPPFDFLARAFVPCLERLGARVRLHLEKPGFVPAGGGKIRLEVTPAQRLGRFELMDRGATRQKSATALVANLPESIGERELATLRRLLSWPPESVAVETITNSQGPGNAVIAEIVSESVTEVFTGFGQRGVSAETVARDLAHEVRRYIAAGIPVGEHLADQLLLPMALGRGGSFRTLKPTLHTRTNIDVIQQFLDVDIRLKELGRDDWHVEVTTPGDA